MQPRNLTEPRTIANVFREIETNISKDKKFLGLPLQNWQETTKTLLSQVVFELALSKVLNKPELCDDYLRSEISKSLLKFVLSELNSYEKSVIDIFTSGLLAQKTHQKVKSLDQLNLGHLRGLLVPLRNEKPASLGSLSIVVELLISHVDKAEILIDETKDEGPTQRPLC